MKNIFKCHIFLGQGKENYSNKKGEWLPLFYGGRDCEVHDEYMKVFPLYRVFQSRKKSFQ